MDDLAEAIRNIPFFSGLSRENLARIAGKLEEERYSAGQRIIKQQDVGDALYIVRSGAVEVVVEHNGVRGESLAIIGPYESFGEIAVFTGQKRSASIIALLDSVVLKLSKETWDGLLAQHPSLSFHFCKVLGQRLAETNRDVIRGLGAFQAVMEEVFTSLPVHSQNLLIRTSVLESLEPEAIQAVLAIPDVNLLLTRLSSNHRIFVHVDEAGSFQFFEYARKFLLAKLEQTLGKQEICELHLDFASYFSSRDQWAAAIHHHIKGEGWNEAIAHLEAHGDEVLEIATAKEIFQWLHALPRDSVRASSALTRLEAQTYVRMGDLDGAIRCYQGLLAEQQATTKQDSEIIQLYQELAELHRKKGQIGEALTCLRFALTNIEQVRANSDAVRALSFISNLQEKTGSKDAALQWTTRALNVAYKLAVETAPKILPRNNQWLAWLVAFAIGWAIWETPPEAPLDERGVRFLATLASAVVLWISGVFDDYLIAIMLLLIWLLCGILPPDIALAGFSTSSWFFVLGVLGIAAAVIKSGLLYRLALGVLRRLPSNHNIYVSALAASGLLVTPLMPDSQARLAIIAPISHVISESLGCKALSNGSAGLVLAAYVGYSQFAFVFLTGSTVGLIGWNLMGEASRSEFGWGMWMLSALPAGIFFASSLVLGIYLLFPRRDQDDFGVSAKNLQAQIEILGPLTRVEWLSIAVLTFAMIGWLAKPWHGVDESWVALAALLIFSAAGVIDKHAFKNNIDWGYLFFLGVISCVVFTIPYLKLDRWIMQIFEPVLLPFSTNPAAFLIAVALEVYLARLLLSKSMTVILFMMGLSSWAQQTGIHPGVLLLTILMSVESWFLPYQTDSYQITYYSTEEKAFTHAQARKLMLVKFLVSLMAIAISVPYWSMLGLIH